MLLATTDDAGGRTVAASLGVVSSQSSLAVAVYREGSDPAPRLLAIGGSVFDAELESVRQTILQQLSVRAKALGGDAVLGIAFSYVLMPSGILLVAASGTAVLLRPAAAS